MNYAAAIRTFRAVVGISQDKLAALAKLNPSYISLLESGKRIPGPQAVTKIAKALGTTSCTITLVAISFSNMKRDRIQPPEFLFEEVGRELVKLSARASTSSEANAKSVSRHGANRKRGASLPRT